MSLTLIYNNEGEYKIVESGEIKKEYNPQWKENTIDKNILNNINRSPKVLFGERIGLIEEQEEQEELSNYTVDIELNGSDFITNENQEILVNSIVNEIDTGNIVNENEYEVNWYLNENLINSSYLFELNTSKLIDKKINILRMEIIIGDEIFDDKLSILKYLGFGSTENQDGSNGNNGSNEDEEVKNEYDGKIIESNDSIIINPVGNGFRVGEPINFIFKHDVNFAYWTFSDGFEDSGSDKKILHNFDDTGIYNIKVGVMRSGILGVTEYECKVKIDSKDSVSVDNSNNNNNNNNNNENQNGDNSIIIDDRKFRDLK